MVLFGMYFFRMGGGQPVDPVINGTCRMVYGQWNGSCSCVREVGAG